jgi:hypothetical protein
MYGGCDLDVLHRHRVAVLRDYLFFIDGDAMAPHLVDECLQAEGEV